MNATVLLLGETGTGKGVVARAIHSSGARKARPLITVNCTTLPATLVESELFGRERGAYTGSDARQIGRFELADGGTIFLDEIGEMPLATQAKLLRVLEDSKVRRLGSRSEISVDVRVLAATNKVPEDAVVQGLLRRDLYFRLNVVNVVMPPLREHLDDIPDLTAALLDNLNRKHGRNVKTISPEALDAMRKYRWPGNVRELRNVLERALVTCSGDALGKESLGLDFGKATVSGADDSLRLQPGMTVAEAERRLIFETLTFTENNKTRAAEMLAISLKTLHNKLKEYEAEPQS
jgi:transcriptional regulator with PAS, ATPase and Fis domain